MCLGVQTSRLNYPVQGIIITEDRIAFKNIENTERMSSSTLAQTEQVVGW